MKTNEQEHQPTGLVESVADAVATVKTVVDGAEADGVNFREVLTALRSKLEETESELDAFELFAPTEVTTADDAEELATHLKRFTVAKKEVDEARKEVTRPLDSFKKMVMSAFKPTLTRLDETTAQIKDALTDFQTKEAQREAEEKAKAERDYLEQVAKSENPEFVGHAPVKKAEKVTGVRTVKKTVATVRDLPAFLTFALAHPEFLEFVNVNESALGQTLGKLGGAVKPDGVDIDEVLSVASK